MWSIGFSIFSFLLFLFSRPVDYSSKVRYNVEMHDITSFVPCITHSQYLVSSTRELMTLGLGGQWHYNCIYYFETARSISEEFSSGDRDTKPISSRGDSESESVPPPSSTTTATSSTSTSRSHEKERERDRERDEETIKVYDGNQGVRRRQFRAVHVPRTATTDQVLSIALKAFHITKPTSNYYLTDAYDEESPVGDPNPIPNLKRREGKRPAVFLRFRYVS